MLKFIKKIVAQLSPKSYPRLFELMEGKESSSLKRAAEATSSDSIKKTKTDSNSSESVKLKKKKIALLAAYCGKNYYGVQIQCKDENFPTIESKLFPALIKSGAVTSDHFKDWWFQRGSRTDKGVSAIGQIFSLKVVPVDNLIEKINNELPEEIRMIDYIKTTASFDSKNFCDSRTYMYMMPTYAFAPLEKFVTEDYRVTDEILNNVRALLQRYVGTHNFHNFTSGVKFTEKRAKRYIIKFECSDPYERKGLQFVTIRVLGQSFMLHQIRKMIGLTIAIQRGYCGDDIIDRCWQSERLDVPKAPGLGLVLEQLHFDGYNRKFGKDGIHQAIDWSPFKETVEKFKEDYIISDIVDREKTQHSMLTWLQTLTYHTFGEREFQREDGSRWGETHRAIYPVLKKQREAQNTPEKPNCSTENTDDKNPTLSDKALLPETDVESGSQNINNESEMFTDKSKTLKNEDEIVKCEDNTKDSINEDKKLNEETAQNNDVKETRI